MMNTKKMNRPQFEEKRARLIQYLRGLEKVAVAFSGGIDSTLMLKIAHDVLGTEAVGITAVSPSVARAELEEARELARQIGAKHLEVKSNEMEDPGYRENTPNRCYYCKTNSYEEIITAAAEMGIPNILDGTNADDADDFRPGRKAAKEKGVLSPFQMFGITKEEIRQWAREAKLPNWNKPAAACLSSRIPYGTPVSEVNLKMVEEAEQFLKSLGIRQVRVRHYDLLARIEVEPSDFEKLIEHRQQIVERFKEIGYHYATMDLRGFRSGSMNEIINEEKWKQQN